MKEYKVEGFDPEKLQAKLAHLGSGGWDLEHLSYIEKQIVASKPAAAANVAAPDKIAGGVAGFLSRFAGNRTILVAVSGAVYVLLRLLGIVPEDLLGPEKQDLLDKLLGFAGLIFAALKGKRIEAKLRG